MKVGVTLVLLLTVDFDKVVFYIGRLDDLRFVIIYS